MVIQIRPDEGKLIVEFPYSPERVKRSGLLDALGPEDLL